MFNIIEMCFMNHSTRCKNSIVVENELNLIKNEIISKIELAKNSPVFMQQILEIYDIESLNVLLIQVQKEIGNRNIKAINNEL